MSIVDASRVSKAYGTRVVLDMVDVTVSDGERIGVVGVNGAGKSTLCRILAGVEMPDGGTVTRRRDAKVLFLDQHPVFDGDPTAEEAVSEGLSEWARAVRRHGELSEAVESGTSDLEALVAEQHAVAETVERLGGWEQRHRIRALLDKLGVERLDARVSTLSGGEQRRVALARTLIENADLVILDEPTNHLDAETAEWLETYLLSETKSALVLITHDRYLLDRVATRTLEVADGCVHAYDGGYELYLEQKAERLAHAARTEQNRQNFLRRELDWLRRQPKARTTKQKARVARAEAALATGRPATEQAATLSVDITRSGKTILEARGLGLDVAGRTLVQDLDLFVTAGQRIGIVGKNGAGKTTLLRALLGQTEPTRGTVTIGKNTHIAYFDQERSGLRDELSVFENVIGEHPRIELFGRVIEPHAYLERFALDGQRSRQRVGSLSGGERARVALARLLRSRTNLLVMDEPTNDLDVATLAALEDMLVEFAVTALVVTHDRWFLDRVATSILAFEGDGRVVQYMGNYESFRRARQQRREESAAVAPPSAEPRRARPSKRGLSYAEKRELETLPDAIDAAEKRVDELTTELADPNTYTRRGAEVASLSAALADAREEVDRLTARWEELELKKLD